MNDPQQPPPPPMMMNPVQPQMMNQTRPMMLNRFNNNPWQLQDHPNPNAMKFPLYPSKPRSKPNSWKGKNVKIAEYNPPSLNDLQTQNRMKARKYYHPKHKKFNNNNNNNRYIPYAPRNTTSFIIRAKKSGGIASLVSPCPVTPAVLPTPIFSPSREVLGDMAKEEWGVDGYGSMKGLIRLRPQNEDDDDDEEEGNGSSESDVEEHVEVERRLDHDLSRFEMIYPSYEYNNVLENRVDDQDTHIAQLEEENLTLKERLFLMEREVGELRRRLGFLERRGCGGEGSSMVGEEVVDNGSENESDGGSDVRMEENVGCEEVVKTGSGFAANCGIAVDGDGKDVLKEENLKNDELDAENVGSCGVGTKRGSGMATNSELAVADDVKDVVMAKEREVNVEELRNESVEVEVIAKENLKNDGNCDDSVMERIVEDELDGKNDRADH